MRCYLLFALIFIICVAFFVANPDRRTRKHKQAVKEVYESTIASLIEKLSEETTRNNELRTRVAQRTRVVAHAHRDDKPTPSCSISQIIFNKLIKIEIKFISNHIKSYQIISNHIKSVLLISLFEMIQNNNHENICNICMDEMKGKVTLNCGHEMCPLCFAQHARVHNLCPFCRDEFAPATSNTSKPLFPRNIAESMVTNTVNEYYYETVVDEIVKLTDMRALESAVYGYMYQSSMNMFYDIEQWYNNNGNE